MASYYLSGYTPPADVTSRDDVKAYQKKLGVTQDGVWGPKTQAAYEKNQSAGAPQSFADYYALAMGYVSPQLVSAGSFSADEYKKELEGYLRPTVDLSVARRREAGKTANAELDADAYSRGMGRSTYLSSMKEREGDDVERDVGALEAHYSAALSEKLYQALAAYQERVFEAQKYNAQQLSAAQNTAAGMAANWYAAAQTPQKAASPGTKGAKGAKAGEPALTIPEIYELMGYLDDAERKNLFTSQTAYWVSAREELKSSVSPEIYNLLVAEFKPKTPAFVKPGGANLDR